MTEIIESALTNELNYKSIERYLEKFSNLTTDFAIAYGSKKKS